MHHHLPGLTLTKADNSLATAQVDRGKVDREMKRDETRWVEGNTSRVYPRPKFGGGTKIFFRISLIIKPD